jgi:hypothetical protein
MMNTTFFKKLAIVLIALFIVSCDKDYNTLGADIIGNENFTYSKYTAITTKIYNQKVDAVETSNSAVNYLGIYENTAFGVSKASFITQVELDRINPNFGTNVVIDSVFLSVPYFSTKGTTNSNGITSYTLDQIYGKNSMSQTNPIDLRIYENGFALLDFDIDNNFSTRKKYFSNEENSFSTFNSKKLGLPASASGTANGTKLNDSPLLDQNTQFKASEKEFVQKIVKGTTTTYERGVPRMNLSLSIPYFRERIVNTNPDNLINNTKFKEYFKGIYFQVQTGSVGSLYSLDFKKGKVIIYYKENNAKFLVAKESKTLGLNMIGNTVNFLENTNIVPAYSNALNTANNVTGDASIYLKGGQGSTAFIDLFDAGELQTLRNNKWLINDATLTFTVDKSKMTAPDKPQRLYVYNADTNQILFDYSFDNSRNTVNPKLSKTLFGGIIQTDANSTVETYKIRIAEHLTDVLKNNKDNVRLGVCITDDINVIDYGFLKTEITSPKKFDRVPKSSIQTPLGTVLYGSNIPSTSPDYDKRLKLEIYYTKPN